MLAPCDSILHELSSLILQCCMLIRMVFISSMAVQEPVTEKRAPIQAPNLSYLPPAEAEAQVINMSGVWGWRCGNIDTSWWTPTGVIMIYSKRTTCWFNITGKLHERKPSAVNIFHSRLSDGKCQRFPAGKPVELQLK